MSAYFLIALLFCFGTANASEWSYAGETGPDHWGDLEDSFCAGNSQSPIDFVTNDVIARDFGEFTFEGYDLSETGGSPGIILNNGHSLQVKLVGNYKLTGGGLPAVFTAVQFHFHWGSTNSQGSEHTVDGKRYPAELHIVHYNSDKFSEPGQAAHASELSLAVLGVFLEIGDEDNEAFKEIFEKAPEVTHEGDKASLENSTFSVAELLPADVTRFLRYNGSLTTPTCNEVVIWTIFEDTVKISENQLKVLRDLREGHDGGDDAHYIVDNYRPIQPLNGRTVYFNSGAIISLSTLLAAICAVVLTLQNCSL